MNQPSPLDATSINEIRDILDQCLAEYWSERFNEYTIDHHARMHAALQPFISYQAAKCPVTNAAD